MTLCLIRQCKAVATLSYYTEEGNKKKCSVFVMLPFCMSDRYRP